MQNLFNLNLEKVGITWLNCISFVSGQESYFKKTVLKKCEKNIKWLAQSYIL